MHAVVLADAERCIGCRACEIACALAHAACGEDPGRAAEAGAAFAPRLTVVRDGGLAVPVQCRQCEAAPCAAACPTGALYSDGRSVAVDTAACTGCKACLAACPGGAMDMLPLAALPGRLVAGKCDLCAGRPARVFPGSGMGQGAGDLAGPAADAALGVGQNHGVHQSCPPLAAPP